jgi:dipeptidyl aminopeptidase/acylaminoacyl peptidase
MRFGNIRVSRPAGWLAILLVTLTLRLGAVEGPPLIPIERFFEDPAITNVRLAPDGNHLAYLAPMNGRIGVALMDLRTGKVDVLVRSADENIDTFLWKGSDYIVYAADVGGNEAGAYQSINIKSRRITRLLESYGENNEARQEGNYGRVQYFWGTNPKKIVVFGSRDKNSRAPGMYEVDVATSRRSPIGGYAAENDRILQMVFDNEARIRVRVRHTFEAIVVEARLADSNRYTPLFTRPRDAQRSELDLATILADNETLLFVDYTNHDRGALISWSLRTGQRLQELFVPPSGEITDLVLPTDKTKLLGVRYEDDKPRVHWLDGEIKAVQAGLDGSFPDTINTIINMTDDRKKFVVVANSDIETGVYFLLDRTRPQPLLMSLGSARPNLESKALARMENVTITARDGLALPGYLTRPAGRGKGPYPFIIVPHGGPYGVRDSWGYNDEIQFLANRGYAVLQVNYRGSGGYGKKFLEAGRLEWGKKMQDDITDSVKWAISQGIADAERVAIYGASYGGYAAMAGVAFTPELYRCAVNYVGAVDMTVLGDRDQGGDRIAIEMFFASWIHPDMEELRRRSPVNHVDKIMVPTFHAYGENDPRVEIRQWRRLKAELDRHNKPYEYLRESNEGHGFSNAKSRIEFYIQMERFLEKHMGGTRPVVRLGPTEVREMPAKVKDN